MTDVDDLLQKTSRTFALTIPLLPRRRAHEVGLAYLLFRIIDTFEDATRWPPDAAHRGHPATSCRCWRRPTRRRRTASPTAACADPPVDHAGYLELLREIPFVLSCSARAAGARAAQILIAPRQARRPRG